MQVICSPRKEINTKGALFVRMRVFEKKKLVVSISLNHYMPLESRKRKKIFSFSERSNQSLSKYIPAENKIRKNEIFEDLLLKTRQVFSGRNLENFSEEYGR